MINIYNWMKNNFKWLIKYKKMKNNYFNKKNNILKIHVITNKWINYKKYIILIK